MSFAHAIRITQPFSDCSGIIRLWAERCHDAIAYQHDADDEISKTHVHIGLGGCEVKAEALKRMYASAPGKGNEFWSFKDWVRKDPSEWHVEMDKFAVYMAKGILAPVFVKNISTDLLEKSRQDWVEPVKADKIGDNSERVIIKVVEKIKKSFVYRPRTDEEISDMVECGVEVLCKLVRKEAFRQLWGEHRRVPHASFYKIVAGSAFMRLCEHYDIFEDGIEVMQNLWY